jgi:ribonuclease Z
LKIELLGTGGHWATGERIANTILVEREPELFLFDVGEGAYRQMQQQNTGFALDAIFLTSTETDHIGGLGPLLSALSIQGQVTDLEIYVPANGVDTIQSLLDLYGEFELSVAIEPVEDGVIYDDDKYTIEAFQTDTDGARRGYVLSEIPQRGRFNRDRAEALGVPVGSDFQRLCEGKIIVTEEDEKVDPRQVVGDPTPGRKLVYTGDVPDPGVIPPVIDSADFLIHEAAYLDDESSTSGHATAKVAGEIAQKADVDALVLTNVAPVSSWRTNQLVDQAAAQFDGEVRLATDGTTLRLPVPEPTDAPAATPAINYGEPVSESDLEEGMYISLTVDRKKNSNKGLSKRGTVHIRDGDKYVGKKVTVKIVSKRTGYVVAVVETPSSGTTVYPYGPTNSSSNGSKQGSSKKNTKSGQKRISNSSSPFKTGDSSHLRDLVQKKH